MIEERRSLLRVQEALLSIAPEKALRSLVALDEAGQMTLSEYWRAYVEFSMAMKRLYQEFSDEGRQSLSNGSQYILESQRSFQVIQARLPELVDRLGEFDCELASWLHDQMRFISYRLTWVASTIPSLSLPEGTMMQRLVSKSAKVITHSVRQSRLWTEENGIILSQIALDFLLLCQNTLRICWVDRLRLEDLTTTAPSHWSYPSFLVMSTRGWNHQRRRESIKGIVHSLKPVDYHEEIAALYEQKACSGTKVWNKGDFEALVVNVNDIKNNLQARLERILEEPKDGRRGRRLCEFVGITAQAFAYIRILETLLAEEIDSLNHFKMVDALSIFSTHQLKSGNNHGPAGNE